MFFIDFLQMSVWLPNGKLYLPPTAPVAKVQSTDEYVIPTTLYCHANTDRLLTVGHPYFEIKDNNKVTVPKVSGNQYRVFRLKFPDPNKFALQQLDIYNPEKERLVWRLRGIEIGRGGPLGIGTTGHPLFNKLGDTENPTKYQTGSKDNRQNTSIDPKQTQMFIVGCVPCTGEHWDVARPCNTLEAGDCPPIQLVNSVIQDGDMCDIGFGNMNFKTLQEDKSGATLDIVSTMCKWPDFLRMTNEIYGDQMFFFGRREQVYARHYFTRNGVMGETIPNAVSPSNFMYAPDTNQDQKTVGPHVYFGTPSGSLVSSDGQLFNRPFWLQRAQGNNNGICWNNELFVTLVDNTRNVNFTISQKTQTPDPDTYDSQNFKQYLRHVEQFELSVIVQLCKVPLEPSVLAHINVMNPNILEDWNLGFVPPVQAPISDDYRYINSLATRCPDQNPPKEKEDPYKDLSFWEVDLTERFSQDLDQFPLGRKFLFQTGTRYGTRAVKRPAIAVAATKRTVKRKKRV
ncbi:L1 [Micromys minutus papillomavirus 1]|uniref:Major capsid protein L1 n=1 Tax=Micromys minutus papillomavirus TaxID=10568 RepID=A0EPK9_MMPV|nr:L1 [Micromys minutus papillomavirus 1]ABB85358.1 L1 [Micromys minutus papillomavirus 1]